ncbi:MAG: hypothetical protein FWH02_00735 [Oscillospiraceae bacterium]|nr:hypothetical protein [Oscillospiraceae bacterium]
MPITISTDRLRVEMLCADDTPVSHRFDRSCFITDVTLDGKHKFCVPEQYDQSRVTSFGAGICAEFVWQEISGDVRAGEKFPKFGTGLLTQIEDNAPYRMFADYELEAYPITAETGADFARFCHDIPLCMDTGAKIYREASVRDNMLTIYTTIENTGARVLQLAEYNHNFLSIDGLPVGPGYLLHIPFDGTLEKIAQCGFTQKSRGEVIPGLMLPQENKTIAWGKGMDGRTFFKETESPDILPMARYFWKLTHENSPASVEETVSFAPRRFALWGIEHCICPEVFVGIYVKPGEKQSWSRTWTFRA